MVLLLTQCSFIFFLFALSSIHFCIFVDESNRKEISKQSQFEQDKLKVKSFNCKKVNSSVYVTG